MECSLPDDPQHHSLAINLLHISHPEMLTNVALKQAREMQKGADYV